MQGLSPKADIAVLAVGASTPQLASMKLTVSDAPVCLVAVDVLAVTGVAIASAGPASPVAPGRWNVSFTPQQVRRSGFASLACSASYCRH